MKQVEIKTRIVVCKINELVEEDRMLYDEAMRVAKGAYAPYSRFQVGAALQLANGVVMTGSNQENAVYPSGLCAERVALFAAGAQHPDTAVNTLALVAFSAGRLARSVSPCGGCRQVLLEVERRYGTPIRLLLCGANEVRIVDDAASLLPIGFDGSDLPYTPLRINDDL